MATIAQSQKDEDNKNNPTGGPTSVANTGGAGSGGQTGQGGAATVSPVQQNASAQNQSGYTDVASYLNANQGGAQKLGESVAGNLTNKYNDTKSGVDKSYGDFSGQVNNGYVPENSDLINQVAANPTGAASNPNQVSAFQSQLNDTYTGPTAWGDYGTQQGKVNEANQYAGLSNTPGGLNVYSQEVEGQTGGPQSQGINQLDTLLLGGSPDAMGQVQGAAKPYQTLNDYINSQNTAGLGQVNVAQTGAQNASQHALDAFTGANGTLTNLNSQIGKETSQAQAQADAAKQQQASILSGINSGTLTPQQLQALGLSQDQYGALNAAENRANTSQYMTGHNFGAASATGTTDLSKYLTQTAGADAQAGTVATPEEYAQMQAIQQLLGSKNPQGNAINPALASLAGTYNPNGATNQFDYNSALGDAQYLGDYERQQAQDQANYLTGQADQAHAASQHGGVWNTVKNTVSHPGNLFFGHMDPRNVLQTLKYASQGKVPTGDNPLPTKADEKKVGVK